MPIRVRFLLQLRRPFHRFFFQHHTSTFTMPKSIPDRWEDYKPIGQAIEGTRFIPFKVPLKQILHDTNQVPKEQSFTPSNLFEVLAEKNLQLGLLIDLTFTKRYYNSEEITSNGVEYQKVFTAGHHVPNLEVVKRFTDVVQQFEKDNADNDLLIGVHCTHGVNRTGYLICRYMIENLKFTPEEALKAYEKARGYPVERKNYVDDLHTRPRAESKPDETGLSRSKRKKKRRGTKKNEQQHHREKKDDELVPSLPAGESQDLSVNTNNVMRHQHSENVKKSLVHDADSIVCTGENREPKPGVTASKSTSKPKSQKKPSQIQLSENVKINEERSTTSSACDKGTDRDTVTVIASEVRVSGIIVKVKRKHCFISRHDGRGYVYANRNCIASENSRSDFKLGDIVMFDVVEDKRGFKASNILIGTPSQSEN